MEDVRMEIRTLIVDDEPLGRRRVRQLLDAPEVSPLESQKLKELAGLMASDAAAAGMEELPDWRLF